MDETESYKIKKAKKNAKKLKEKDNKEVHNFETLNAQWKQLSCELQKLKVKLAATNLKSAQINEDKQPDIESDSLDTFMKNVDSDKESMSSSLDVKINKSKLRVKISELEKEQRRLERLIKIAKPSFHFEERCSSNAILKKNNENQTIKDKTIISEMINKKINEQKVENDKDEIAKQSVFDTKELQEAEKKEKAKIDLKISKRVCKTSIAAHFLDNEVETKKAKLNIEQNVNKEDKDCKNQQFGLIIRKEKKAETKVGFKSESKIMPNYLNSEDYIEWVPPTDQSGDGKTSLNEKLGY